MAAGARKVMGTLESQFYKGFSFAIDRGGTFTDVYARTPTGKAIVMKLLSEDPTNYSDAPREGIRRILEKETGIPMPANEPINPSYIDWIRMGTTVATNALLERNGERMALVINQGFKDLLYIGNQSRPHIFDLKIEMPEVLYEKVVEVKERLVLAQEKCGINYPHHGVVTGASDVKLEVWEKIDKTALAKDLQHVYDQGIRSLAVVLMHSYIYYNHESEIGDLAKEIGFSQVSLSSEVMPMIKIVPRGFTACADAYLTPCIKRYVEGFAAGFQDGLKNVRVLFMQSDGGLTPVQKFTGSRAILSGPAGGVVGYAMTAYNKDTGQPVIGFDMGGTSTDVSRYAGHLEHVFETTTAGITIQAPQLDINTVAAGGGSRLFFRSGIFIVGPQSVGAHPGPVCYRKAGNLAVTDANLILGRLLPKYFPCIFGPSENQPLDRDASYKEFNALTKEINEFLAAEGGEKESMLVEEVAMGFIKVANENMCRPIRALTQAKGHDTSRHVLACFGGAGGQHACSIARTLGMSVVYIHKYAGILSAYGIALADVVHEAQETCSKIYCQDSFEYLDKKIEELERTCERELQKQGFDDSSISTEAFLHMRYEGTDCALMCSGAGSDHKDGLVHGDFKKSFLERYSTEFGFVIPDRQIIVDDVRVRATGHSSIQQTIEATTSNAVPVWETTTKCYFEDGFLDTKVFLFEKLCQGHEIEGPAIIIDKACTILVEPFCTASITNSSDIRIQVGRDLSQRNVTTELDAIQLSIFSHRFMSIAEQMGRVLQRTSISTNIKERLDFSCAMFGPDGGLVANAPHIPVHLGAMQETVQYQMKALGDNINEGDVILCNHPCCGGSHLPDLTVITPVFYPGQPRPVFYVANRGHHADIGGITPGSMPPHSKILAEEGATFKSFKLVQEGIFDEEGVTAKLMEPKKYPGSTGTRNLRDNLSDLKAQVAANQKGIGLITELIDEYNLDVVQAYMNHIQTNAEVAVRDVLKEIATRTKERVGRSVLTAVDYMDDGTPICLTVSIQENDGGAVFDFTGTGPEVYGNCNAPRAIILSAIIYCLRCMVGHDVPLNQGCLKPVQLVIPPGTILSPSETSAVVGGNVLTTQRIVDVVFKAFQTCAASQGCMNNTTFGDECCGYYETVAGGAGAGPNWEGKSGVHTHMTNTRITDPEIIEKRYPVVLRRFQLNPGSGGDGLHKGGDGVVRELMFRRPLTLSILSERRAFSPYGLKGGSCGSRGLNLLIYPDGRKINLGGKASVKVNAGDCFHLETPGGGGYGNENDDVTMDIVDPSKRRQVSENGDEKKFVEKGSVYSYRMMQESA